MAALQDFAGKAMSWGELHRRVRAWYEQRCIEPECEGFVHDFGRCRAHVMSDIETLPHGTLTAYTDHRCRCPTCTNAMRAYYREYRARKREANQAHRRVVPGR
jgi:hypothetical protein